MLIQEVILENFMSYEYARIPFRSGVNVICGPNGAGKSSILLAISLALGQSYTERSRKLSNLIRWDKDQARVTLVLDNSPRDGKRPVRKFKRDQIFLTRELRRDGKYWFALENRAVTKRDVERTLAKFNVDPDNLLIIMHQSMSEYFTVFSAEEKLRTVEAAVGLEPYRRNVLQARRKLRRILSEEESVNRLLESAEQTLNYWRGQYDRYQQKKQLQMKRQFLEREFAWAKAYNSEVKVKEMEQRLKAGKLELEKIEGRRAELESDLDGLQTGLERAKLEWKNLFEERLSMEREKIRCELSNSLKVAALQEMGQWVEDSRERLNRCMLEIENLGAPIKLQRNPHDNSETFNEIKKTYKHIEDTWTRNLTQKSENLKTLLENLNEELEKTNKNLQETTVKTGHIEDEVEKLTTKTIDTKIETALLDFKKQIAEKEIRKQNKNLKLQNEEYRELLYRAEQTGPKIASTKQPNDILDEIRLTDGHLSALTDVSEDIERMYESYSKLYLDLKEKAQTVAQNRENTLLEIDARMAAWRTVIQNLLQNVNLQYKRILAEAQATGQVKLVDAQDIEAAGLEVMVGFKGAEPVPLDAYTQSGGERSMATISFLLALQQHVQSPFRAVDEYDVHMDPKNRETITNLLIELVEDSTSQYLIITPGQLTFKKKNVHIITVQNVEGSSQVKQVA